LRVGISPCPNDTFAFHALLEGQVDTPGLALELVFADIEELNRLLVRGELDVAKASYHLGLKHARELRVLPVGSALGFGVGPLLIAARADRRPDQPVPEGTEPARVLLPGENTTAALLWDIFHGGGGARVNCEHVVFSEIFPRLEAGRADFGVCIHEGRFTWREHGLHRVEDLGESFEQAAQAPLPLGGLFALRRVDLDVCKRLTAAVRASLEWSLERPEAALPTMRAHAQEMAEAVMRKHVELYVNEWTLDLGPVGRRAIEALEAQARRVGALSPDSPALEVCEA
jgi:1,4-dihydroxy-6-naphthoate synthase